MNNSSVFLFCSGKATRLRPLSHFIPKPVLPWSREHKSMLELNIEKYLAMGYSKFYITYSSKRRQYERIIKKFRELANITLIYEKEPVGQIKSVLNLGSNLNQFQYTVCQNGDTLSLFNLKKLFKQLNRTDISCVLASSKQLKELKSTIICQTDGTVVGIKRPTRQKMFYKYSGETSAYNYLGTLILRNSDIIGINGESFIGLFGENDLLEQLAKRDLYAKCINVECEEFYSFNNFKEYFKIRGRK